MRGKLALQEYDLIVVAETAWDVFSAALVFLLGVIVALQQKPVFGISSKKALFLYAWHTGFCLFYLYYSLSAVTDAKTYFLISTAYRDAPQFGTEGIYYLTSIFSAGLGMSYIGAFLVYNVFGFVGMLAFASILSDMVDGQGKRVRRLALLILLLPGLSFWSSAIGKDSLTFMGAGLACWAAGNLGRRYPAMVLAVIAFLLPRPHMAGILLASMSVAAGLAYQGGFARKLLLNAIIIPAAIVGVLLGARYAGIWEATSISEYIERRQEANLGHDTSIDISSMSVPMRAFTYMFRPFFFDAPGALGMIVSLENLLLLMVTLVCVWSALRNKPRLSRFEWMFLLTFSGVSILVLSNTTANLGLALRQKWMFMPMYLVLLLAYLNGNRRVRSGRASVAH